MQILTSGSFINFDNAEKIEQLVFTAKAIADSAVGTDGFVSSEENNKRLALEIWQGAEYMTREHERARIQNLFVSNFLERLREIVPAPATNETNEKDERAAEISPVESNAAKDEFLGFVSSAAEGEIQENDDADFEEKAGEADPIKILPPNEKTGAAEEDVQDENLEPDSAKSVESPAREAVEAQRVVPEGDKMIEPELDTETPIAEVSQTIKAEQSAVGAFTLPEKEPYRWDDCTVTATIQLLPVETGIRRVVLSVRTHDFAPQISVVELSGAESATPENFAPALAKVFERYQIDLPVKVMDKMKREKSAGKKQQPKTPVESKPNLTAANSSGQKTTQSEANAVGASAPTAKTNQTALPAASQTVSAQTSSTANRGKTSKPENSAQGSLFGF